MHESKVGNVGLFSTSFAWSKSPTRWYQAMFLTFPIHSATVYRSAYSLNMSKTICYRDTDVIYPKVAHYFHKILITHSLTCLLSPGHTLQCCTPAMVCSKHPATSQNRMRCAVIESSTCSIFCSWFWKYWLFVIWFPNGFQHFYRDLMGFHVTWDP